ncbi:amino acid permease [Tumebacillus permanentifrigoris]|uniref:Amino acid/polyamine/organocation transporter (APC superfamily) n=1 Tax=Tumebacillus permanentifrigoris TaxID=378543 RepID=A0A316D8M7_9BACL|nr:amino acid permease [Tumebacillus permanentifrigoris]PWK12820.1 amino acid/polyamine/organocation transporter (APC superfamily) [Tumebacillus permanentifrigoris]
MSRDKQELARSLKERHIMMIALGGAIGAGIFKGSSSSITMAGPSVVFAYLLGGIILLFVMQGLAEMAVRNTRAVTFRDLLEPILGRFAGYFAGWIYWITWVLVMAAEIAAAAVFLSHWFTTVPLWVMALIVSIALTVLNLFQANVFGETEFWLTGVKIITLVMFILIGGLLLFTGFGDHPATGFQHLTDAGGFFPNGLSGLAQSMLVVMLSFGGTEMIGMTLGETQDASVTIPRAARGVIYRVLVFYILPILIITALVPWNQLGEDSPFVSVFSAIGIPYVGDIMNFVMLTAVLSAANTGMYATSRMLFTQATDGEAPRYFAKLSKNKVPARALLASTAFLYISVIIAFFAKGHTFDYLMVIPGYSIMITWMLLLVAHLKSRQNVFDAHEYHVKAFPVTTWIALIALVVIFLAVVATSPVPGTLVALLVMVLVAMSYQLLNPRKSTDARNSAM